MAVGGRYGGRKVREGIVVSDKMQKSLVVAVEANLRHPIYKKTVRRMRRYLAHDEANDCRRGDRVRIVETRPLSRHKRWRVVEVLQRSELPEEEAPEAIDLELLGEVKGEEAKAETHITEAPQAASSGVTTEPGPEAVPVDEPGPTEAEGEESR